MSKINISYGLKEFMDYKECNTMLPLNLKSLCNDLGGTLIMRDIILKEVGQVIDSFVNGKNPNDIVFKNTIIENLNKINQTNYNIILESFRKLSFSKYEHFSTLSLDLLLRAMTDITGIKGVEMPEGQKSLSELYGDIIVEFSQLMIKDTNNNDMKFITIFMNHCQKYFMDFIDPSKQLDSNNQYRVDNYKGFMNFMGILFNKNVVSHKIIMTCILKIKELMYTQQWVQCEQNECENVYEGYRLLLNKIYSMYTKTKLSEQEKEFVKNILVLHNDIRTQNEKLNKLRKFTMMSHKDLEMKLNKLTQ